jgi:cohesin complex subunit SCC1
MVNPANLLLADVLTEIDLLQPMPDPSLLLSQHIPGLSEIGFDDPTVPDWDHSQFLSASVEQPRAEPMNLADADDLNLDFGDDLDLPQETFDEGTSIERGMDAPPPRRFSEELASSPKLLDDDDLGLDIGEDEPSAFPAQGDLNLDLGDDIDMGGMTDIGAPGDTILAEEPALEPRARDSISPLSSIRSSVERDLEQTFNQDRTAAFEPQEEEDESVHQAQRAKRRKVLHADAETEIPNTQIREQQNDRSKIMKPSSFLPRDPMLLALINMQKSGGFVSSILSDGRSRGWAPELRGILSLEVVSRPGQKRKRDSGVADLETEEEEATAGAEQLPQLEFDQGEPTLDDVAMPIRGASSLAGDEDMIQLPSEAGVAPMEEEPIAEDEEGFSPGPDNFDDTTVPLLHPAESGPVSLGTKRAVHLLRDTFGPEAETNESERQKTTVLFQDMLPEATTTRADATKMFFEVLVLATKDAIKVEQPLNELGGPLRIRAKRGLWGSWAETSAAGELASQSMSSTTGVAPDVPSTVAVEA